MVMITIATALPCIGRTFRYLNFEILIVIQILETVPTINFLDIIFSLGPATDLNLHTLIKNYILLSKLLDFCFSINGAETGEKIMLLLKKFVFSERNSCCFAILNIKSHFHILFHFRLIGSLF